MHPQPFRPPRGFTIVELMVTVAVLAILLAVAIPGFRTMTIRSRTASYANDFVATLLYARTEAIRRGLSVTVCKSSDGTGCTPAAQWEQGWIVFVDVNANGKLDPPNDTLLRVWGPLVPGYTLRTGNSDFADFLRYRPDGTLAAPNTPQALFAICSGTDTTTARVVEVTLTLPRASSKTPSSCTNPS